MWLRNIKPSKPAVSRHAGFERERISPARDQAHDSAPARLSRVSVTTSVMKKRSL
jgi:hypothetical protein